MGTFCGKCATPQSMGKKIVHPPLNPELVPKCVRGPLFTHIRGPGFESETLGNNGPSPKALSKMGIPVTTQGILIREKK